MMDNALYRFTHAEFFVMLTMAGAGNCTVYIPEAEPNDAALIQAMTSLYRRGMLRREGDRFVPDGAGALFSSLREVKCVAQLFSAPRKRSAVCYLLQNHLWMTELLRDGCRIQKLRREEMYTWLLDAGILKPPSLTSLDLPEMTELYSDELEHPQGECLLRIEKRRNGEGGLIREYQVLRGPGIEILLTSDGISDRAEFCSKDTLAGFISECFSEA